MIYTMATEFELNSLKKEISELHAKLKMNDSSLSKLRDKGRNGNDVLEDILKKQINHTQRPFLPLLIAIEDSWSPQLAIMGVKFEDGGKKARLEVVVVELMDAFLFVESLNSSHQKTVATLLRHSTLAIADKTNVLVANIEVVIK